MARGAVPGAGAAQDPDGTDRPGGATPGAAARFLARHALVPREVALGAYRLTLLTLPNPDALLDAMTQEEFDRSDGRMPYWAVLWPSATALAEAVVAGPPVAGRRVLDLGCGLGLAGLAALHRGAHVTFLDWEPVALEVARASAWAAGLSSLETVACDWRTPPPLAPFDLVLGADLLYEARNGPAVARFLATHLAPGGEAWITDPGRLHAREFPADLAAAGLAVVSRTPLPPRDDAPATTLWKAARARP
jgi:predicted nicotinamide N-methyase